MRWHHENASKDGIMHHPVDSLAWKTIDSKWPDFSNDPRNVRLAMVVDGLILLEALVVLTVYGQ